MSEKSTPAKLTIEINGTPYHAEPGEMVIQVADRHGVYIPRFCYHKKLSVAANCRMCLVEIENARKPSPACATPVMDGMKVFTKSPKTLSYQKKVMEFLLINHPLDCPICDQGGECELQDLSLGYGHDVSKYSETKRTFNDPSIGPLIATDMTRCIQCTRCVRFGEEIAGEKELGALGRGDHTHIGTYIQKTVTSELSGNIIDLCPVGALTSKPFRFQARAWELQQYPTISSADAIGANLYAHTRRGELMRLVPKENQQVNETWLADKDRYSYIAVHSEDRIKTPMIKKNGDWCEVSWEEALDFVKVAIEQTKAEDGRDKIAALASESLSTEAYYLLQKLMRQIGSNNLDTRIKQGAAGEGIYSGLGLDCDLETIENADAVLLIGSFLRKEMPLLNHRVHKAVKKGADVFALNSEHYNFNYPVNTLLSDSGDLLYTLSALVKVLSAKVSKHLPSADMFKALLKPVDISSDVEALATHLLEAKAPVVICGFDALLNPAFDQIYTMMNAVKLLLGAKGGTLSFGANAKGALYGGMTPEYLPKLNQADEKGRSAQEILSGEADMRLLILAGFEPEKDSIYGEASLKALGDIDVVVALSTFDNQAMREYADIILPMSTHFEEEGSFINLCGLEQHFSRVTAPLYQSKPLWKILRVLGNLLNFDGFDYQSVREIHEEWQVLEAGRLETQTAKILASMTLSPETVEFAIMSTVSMYQTDGLLRRSLPLQASEDAKWSAKVRISPMLAAKFNLKPGQALLFAIGDKEMMLDCLIDDKIAEKTLAVPLTLLSPCAEGFADVKITAVVKEVEAS